MISNMVMALAGPGALLSAYTGGFFLVTLLISGLILYVYSVLVWMTIAKKLKYKNPWLAWIPIANCAMILQLGNFNWLWIFLAVIPIFGWIALAILGVIATWRIFEKRNYPGWFSLSLIIPNIGAVLYLIAIGFVAWKDRRKMLKIG